MSEAYIHKIRVRIAAIKGHLADLERLLDEKQGAKAAKVVKPKKKAKKAAKRKAVKVAKKTARKATKKIARKAARSR